MSKHQRTDTVGSIKYCDECTFRINQHRVTTAQARSVMDTARLRDKVREEIEQFTTAIELMTTMHDLTYHSCVLSAPIEVLQKALSAAQKEWAELPHGVYAVDEYAL